MNELSALAKEFFGLGDSPREISVVLPSVSHNRRVSLQCANYPIFKQAISYDDALSAFRIHSLLSNLYGELVQVLSHEQLTRGKPNHNLVLIGGPPTNSFTYDRSGTAVIRFGEESDVEERTIRGRRGIYKIEFSSNSRKMRTITRDYCLITKKRRGDITEWVVAGLRAYGQLASTTFLGAPEFYRRCSKLGLPALDEFQLVVRVDVNGNVCPSWTIVDWFPGHAATYDVFICYKHADKDAVKTISKGLLDCGVSPWLDEWDMRPGDAWTETLSDQILKCKSAAIFLGTEAVDNWQRVEYKSLIEQFVRRDLRIVPVLLPGSADNPALPLGLATFQAMHIHPGTPQDIAHLVDALRVDP
jgi:hypothetical protein